MRDGWRPTAPRLVRGASPDSSSTWLRGRLCEKIGSLLRDHDGPTKPVGDRVSTMCACRSRGQPWFGGRRQTAGVFSASSGSTSASPKHGATCEIGTARQFSRKIAHRDGDLLRQTPQAALHSGTDPGLNDQAALHQWMMEPTMFIECRRAPRLSCYKDSLTSRTGREDWKRSDGWRPIKDRAGMEPDRNAARGMGLRARPKIFAPKNWRHGPAPEQ